MIALTITSCKRLELFLKTIDSLSNNLIDKELIELIIHYDDSSSNEDRSVMSTKLQEKFPNTRILRKFYQKDCIQSDKRHRHIMRDWMSNIQSLNIEYVFHIEDDWLFEHNFNLTDALDILKNNPEVALVGFAQLLRNPPLEFEKPKQIGNFWQWIYMADRPTQDLLFMDYDEMSKSEIPGYWCYFINWPYFSFRPGLHDVKKLSQLNNFSEEGESFELEFAKEFAKKFKSYNHITRICRHIGDISSYKLNESKR